MVFLPNFYFKYTIGFLCVCVCVCGGARYNRICVGEDVPKREEPHQEHSVSHVNEGKNQKD